MRIIVGDVTMAYDDIGDGLPLLFIHGYPLNRAMWMPQYTGLCDVARVLTPDLRGFGESSPTPGIYSMDLLADDCHAFLDALHISRPVVICGLSMGGYVTFAFYRKYTSQVAALILAATRPGPDSAEAKANRELTAALAQEKGAAAMAKSMLPRMMSPKTYTDRSELVAYVWGMMESASIPGIAGVLLGMRDRPDSTPTLAQINRPTLILHGADDPLIPVSEAEAMHRAIANSCLVILPDAGHLPNLEQPERFNDAVREFVKGMA